MSRWLMIVGILLGTAALLGADTPGTQLQQEMAELLDRSLGLQRQPSGELGGEYSFIVTPTAIKAMKNFRDSSTPILITNTNELAAKKSDILKAMGFIPREAAPNDQEVFQLDVTDVTIKNLQGKTVTILSDGTVKLKTTR